MRKTRSDIRIGPLEKKLGLPKNTIKNPDGTNARQDETLGTLREKWAAVFESVVLSGNPPMPAEKPDGLIVQYSGYNKVITGPDNERAIAVLFGMGLIK